MKTAVKFFNGNIITKVEEQVNKFIVESNIEVVDIKITTTVHMFTCAIIYRNL